MDGERRAKAFEQIGIQQQLFDREQVQRAWRIADDEGLELRECLLREGALDRSQLRGLERAVTYRLGRDDDKEIAELLIESHYCEAPAVETALTRQKELYTQSGELVRLGVLLVRSRAITETQRIASDKIHGIVRVSGSQRSPNKR